MGSLPPTYTTAQAAAMLRMDSRSIRKTLEGGVIPASPSALPFPALVYLTAERMCGVKFSLENKRALYQRIVERMNAEPEPEFVELSPILRVQIRDIVRELRARSDRFRAWSRRIVQDPQIMGGAPVFPNSRLTVNRVAALLERGEDHSVVLDDYPDLTEEDLEFAPIYVKAFPQVGRPSRARQITD